MAVGHTFEARLSSLSLSQLRPRIVDFEPALENGIMFVSIGNGSGMRRDALCLWRGLVLRAHLGAVPSCVEEA